MSIALSSRRTRAVVELARRLYGEVFNQAARAGHDCVCCEVNCHPPNPQSDAFHAALGFTQIGAGSTHGGAKIVRYLMRRRSW